MATKVERARDILSQEGVGGFLHECWLYLLRNTSMGNEYLLDRSIEQLTERMSAEADLDDIVDTVLEVHPGIQPYQISALQLRSELTELARFVDDRDPRTVMEIGTANGGTLYTWCRYFDSVEDVISVDLPGGRFGGGYPERKQTLYRSFDPDKRLHFVRGDSHDDETFEAIQSIIQSEEFATDHVDFLFIDGDHTYEGVKQDFKLYSNLVADDGIIALHDIAETCNSYEDAHRIQNEFPDAPRKCFTWTSDHRDTEVHRFWQELVEEYETREFVEHPAQIAYGIGAISI